MLHKLINRIILIVCCFLLLMPVLASAEVTDEESTNKGIGQMDWKIDRIIKKDSQQNKNETELEKSFPDLFKEETTTIIHQVKEKEQQSFNELKDGLFTTDINASAMIEETKEMLFTADYVAPRTVDTEEEAESSSSSILMVSLAALACVVSGAVFLLFQKLTG